MKKQGSDELHIEDKHMQRLNTLASLTGMLTVFLFLVTMVFITYFPPQAPVPTNLPVLQSPTPVLTATPASPPPTSTPAPLVELLSVEYLQAGADCQVEITVRVTGSAARGSFYVWNASDSPAGQAFPQLVLQVGTYGGIPLTLGGHEPESYIHEVWYEYNGTSSNRLTGLICPGLTPEP